MENKDNRNSQAPILPGPDSRLQNDHGPTDRLPDGKKPTGPERTLRRKAEKLARSREAEQSAPGAETNGTVRQILHELLVHQIELELQNAELRAAQVQVEEARARYFELYDLAPVGYMILSQNGIITEANITAASILGLAKHDILKQPFTRFIVSEDQDLYYMRNRKLFSTLDPQVFELRVHRADQQIRWVQLTETASESSGNGAICRMVMSDVTDRKIAENLIFQADERAMALVEKLQKADHNKNKFLNVLSHELRNPLAAITMSLSLQDMVQPGSESAMRAGEILKRQTAQLTHLVDDLLDITRITQNKITLKKKPLELVELSRRVVADYQQAYAAKGVELAAVWPEEPIRLEGDSVRLIQVIGNLLHNALKFADAGGKVVVTLAAAGQFGNQPEAVLQVSDNGVGMTPELQQELFEPFVQADNSLNRSLGGLGLGLAVVKGMVEMHGGRVEAASEGLGKGSQFMIHLPLIQEEPACTTASRSEDPSAARSLRILLIEDNADLMQIMMELLALLGHEVEAASTGTEGVGLAESFHPDVVICDIGLPGLSGYKVARNLSQSGDRKRPFLIAISGYALPEDIAKSSAAGFDRHMAKPVDLTILRQTLSDPELISRLGPEG